MGHLKKTRLVALYKGQYGLTHLGTFKKILRLDERVKTYKIVKLQNITIIYDKFKVYEFNPLTLIKA